MKSTISIIAVLTALVMVGLQPTYAQGSLYSGIFVPDETYPTGDNPTAISLGDLNGDGYLDMVITNGEPYYTNDIAIILWDPLESTCRHASLSIL